MTKGCSVDAASDAGREYVRFGRATTFSPQWLKTTEAIPHFQQPVWYGHGSQKTTLHHFQIMAVNQDRASIIEVNV